MSDQGLYVVFTVSVSRVRILSVINSGCHHRRAPDPFQSHIDVPGEDNRIQLEYKSCYIVTKFTEQ